MTTTQSLRDRLTSRRMNTDADAATIHPWLTDPKAGYWEMLEADRADVVALIEASEAAGSAGHGMRLGFVDGEPQFLYELYEPRESELADPASGYEYRSGDWGMHLLVAPTDAPLPGFTLAVITHIMWVAFIEYGAQRVVVEPDVRNTAVHRLNAAVGFIPDGAYPVGNKTALLSYCTRDDFLRSVGPDLWRDYARRMVVKILAEFSHERLLTPQEYAPGRYRVTSDGGDTIYDFAAEILALDNWCIDPLSVRRLHLGESAPLDPVTLICDIALQVGIGSIDGVARSGSAHLGSAGDKAAAYLEELTNTLVVGASRAPQQRRRSRDLVEVAGAPADAFQRIEAAMTEGHPCFVANAGRVGFSATELTRYAPEYAPRLKLRWVAARTHDCEFAAMSGIDYPTLLRRELDAVTLEEFDAIVVDAGGSPSDYYYLPVHPWQWENRVARLCAPELAAGHLIDLGTSPSDYQPQQSIRSLFNVSQPHSSYVKVSLSITNMGFTRGMSADYMSTTPLINDWVRERLAADPYLTAVGFEILYEEAAIGYRNPTLNAITEVGSDYRKLVSALWRQSPLPLLREGESLATMAALLHIDHNGEPFIGALIAASELPVAQWIRRYLDAYLHPIVYLLYRHELKFSPHGENIILIVKDSVPVRVVLKDIGEEVVVLGAAEDLPAECSRARTDEADDSRNLGILSDIFDDFLRPLASVLHGNNIIDDEGFWRLVAESIVDFHTEHSDLGDRLARWNLFTPSFGAIHLNQLQIRNSRRMVTPGDAYGGIVAGDHRLINPIAACDPRQPIGAAHDTTASGVSTETLTGGLT